VTESDELGPRWARHKGKIVVEIQRTCAQYDEIPEADQSAIEVDLQKEFMDWNERLTSD
jgi:hypothetical protein